MDYDFENYKPLGSNTPTSPYESIGVGQPTALQQIGSTVLNNYSRVATPLGYLQQLLFGATEDLSSITNGKFQNKFLRTIGQTPYYLTAMVGGQMPEKYSTGQSFIASQLNTDINSVPKWAGIAADFLVDPLLFGSWLGGVGKGAKLLGQTGMGDDLVNLGKAINYHTSLQGVVENTGRGIGSLTGRMDLKQAANGYAMEWLGEKAAGILAKPSPFNRPGGNLLTQQGDGINNDIQKLSWSELVFPFGKVPGSRNDGLDNIARARQLSVGQQHYVGRVALDSINNINAAFDAVVPQVQARPTAKWLADNLGGLFKRLDTTHDVAGYDTFRAAMNNLAGSYADNLSSKDLDAASKLAETTMASIGEKLTDYQGLMDKRTQAVDDLFAGSRTRERFIKKSDKLAEAFGIDKDATFQAVETAAKELYKGSAIIGGILSGGSEFLDVVADASAKLGIDRYTFLQRLTKEAARPDLSRLQRTTTKDYVKLRGISQYRVDTEDTGSVLTVFDREFSTANAFNNQQTLPQRGGLLAALKLDDNIKSPAQMAQMLEAPSQTVYDYIIGKTPSLAKVLTPDMRPAELLETYGMQIARNKGFNVVRVAGDGDKENTYTDLFVGASKTLAKADISSEMKDASKLGNAFRESAIRMGLNYFSTVNPEDYMRNLVDGYAKKIYRGILAPAELLKKVQTHEIVPYKGIDYAAFDKQFSSTYGAQGGLAVTNYLKGTDTGTVSAKELAAVLSINLKRTVSPDEVAQVLVKTSPELQMTADAVKLLTNKSTALSMPNQTGLQYSLQRRQFAERTVNDALSQMLIEEQGATARMAALGLSAGKAVTSQTVLDGVYKALDAAGVFTPGPTQNATASSLRYIQLGDDAETWGALAGKSIPLWAAKEVTRIIAAPAQERAGMLGRLMTGIRSGYLSGGGTVVRNVTGNLALLHQNGVPLDELFPYLPKAYTALIEREAGRGNAFAGSEELLNLFSDGSLSRSNRNVVEQSLIQAMGGNNRQDTIDKFTNFMQDLSNTKPFGWLEAFQRSEDVMRAAVYMWSRDRLVKKGFSPEESVRMASNFANNALYDYSAVGEGVKMLRDNGLALFPAFAYFTIGNVARQVYSKPGALAMQEQGINAASQALVPDNTERDRLGRIIQDTWLGEKRPIPIPAGNGKYYMLPLDSFLPQGALSKQGIKGLLSDPMMGGFYKPLIDLTYAIASGRGQAWLGNANGQPSRVYTPTDPITAKAADVGRYFFDSFAPSGIRNAAATVGKLPLIVDGNQAKRAADSLDRWMNTDIAQTLTKPFGANLYTYDTTGRSARGRSRQIMAQYNDDLQQWQAEYKRAWSEGNEARLRQLLLNRERLDKGTRDALDNIWNAGVTK